MKRIIRVACESGECVFNQEPLSLFAMVALLLFGVVCVYLLFLMWDEEKAEAAKKYRGSCLVSFDSSNREENLNTPVFSTDFANDDTKDGGEK